MNNKYDFSVYIGRFECPTNAHIRNIREALKIANEVIIVVGSDNKPVDWKNPWTTQERIKMLERSLELHEANRVSFVAVEDRLYQNSEWESSVYEAVRKITGYSDRDPLVKKKICIIGYNKDESSFYLNSFPTWDFHEVTPYLMDGKILNATDIRNMIFEGNIEGIKSSVSPQTYDYIIEWLNTEKSRGVIEWYEFDKAYQKPYEALPYGTNFYCADIAVFQSNHVLMIKRRDNPGKDLWALPGGHINQNETAYEACLRELKEETSLKVALPVLNGSFVGVHTFDHPDRSLRGRCGKKVGRTISQSHCFVLEGKGFKFPRIKAGDDAIEAHFFHISDIKNMGNMIFEDHQSQILFWHNKIVDRNCR